MKVEKSITKSKIEEILIAWNKNCEASGLDESFVLNFGKVVEDVTLNHKGKDIKGTVTVGRVTLNLLRVVREQGEHFADAGNGKLKTEPNKIIDVITLQLYSNQFPIKKKTFNDAYWQEILSKELLYEMLGSFCMMVRGVALQKIEIQKQNQFISEIEGKINAEENAILNKPESEKTEEDKVFAMMNKAQKVKVQKTGLVDRFGDNIVSETVSE